MKERDWAVGILRSPPEMRFIPSGKAVTTFVISIDGEEGLLEVTTWEYLAEACNQELIKGNKVSLKGKPYTRRWEDNSGNAKERVGITAYRVFLLKTESTTSEISRIEIEKEIKWED